MSGEAGAADEGRNVSKFAVIQTSLRADVHRHNNNIHALFDNFVMIITASMAAII
jgi:hypothetical protein